MSLRVLFIVNYFPKISETFILNQITDIVARGHNVKIYAFKHGNRSSVHQSYIDYDLAHKTTYFQPLPRAFGIKQWAYVVFLLRNFSVLSRNGLWNVSNSRRLRKYLYQQYFYSQLSRLIEAGGFDIVHAHFGHRGAVVADMLYSGWMKRSFKFITSFHGYDLIPTEVGANKIRYRNIFRYVDAITVNSLYLESLLKQVNPNAKSLHLLYEGLRTSQYLKGTGLVKHSSEFVIVFCGRLVEFKAPDMAVRIIDLLVNQRNLATVRLRIIGDGELREELQSLIREFKVEKNVVLLGALTQELVIKEFQNADLFLLPGIHERLTDRAEAQGLVIQEAQAAELPVIVSDAGGIKYGLINGVTGAVIPQNDLEKFADAIESLFYNPDKREQMGIAGRDFVVKNFDTEVLGRKLEDLYHSLLPMK